MTARYNGLQFKTRLEAQWAAFFDLAGWSFWVNPVAVGNWQADFKVSFPCSHSECGGSHALFATVLDTESLDTFHDHPCGRHHYGVRSATGEWLADGGAALGRSPSVTAWQISHGAGGGSEEMTFRVPNTAQLWKEAAALVTD